MSWRTWLVPSAVAVGVLVILAPLPAWALDFLLAINLAVSTILLLTAFTVRSPLELSVFPTVLLVVTTARLVLNIASTRLILSDAGAVGLDAAGGMIRAFGDFVAGDRLGVGILLFLMISIVQFLVITKGATRIGEVAARFSLDALPGRQLAVDADLSRGAITEDEARARRTEIAEQSDFYAAMDGASKFVRGDAIASLLILACNIVGGLVMGVQAGLELPEAAVLYTRLTIGDGLVGQVPALLVSLAAGVLLTRSASPRNLSSEFLGQLFARPEALGIVALLLLALVGARLPATPLIVLGGACAALSWNLSRGAARGGRSEQSARSGKDHSEPSQAASPIAASSTAASSTGAATAAEAATTRPVERRAEDMLRVDPLVLELGVGLLRLADPRHGGDLIARVSHLRELLAAEIGVLLPRVRVRDNILLERHDYRILLDGAPIAHGELRPTQVLAFPTAPAAELEDVEPWRTGAWTTEPVDGRTACWVAAAASNTLELRGIRFARPADVLMGHFREVALEHAPELLTREATRRLLDQLRDESPAVVDELSNARIPVGRVQQVLRGLLAERVSIRPLATILETLADAGLDRPGEEDIDAVVENARRRLSRTLCAPLCQGDRLHGVSLAPEWEQTLQQEGPWGLADDGVSAVVAACEGLQRQSLPPVVLVRRAARRPLRERLRSVAPRIHVLAWDEVPRGVQVIAGASTDHPRHIVT